MRRRERNKKIVEDLAINFGLDPNDDEVMLKLPETMENLQNIANSPDVVVAFVYHLATEQVELTTPNLPLSPDALRLAAEGCMEAAKQYNRAASQVKNRQKQFKEKDIESIEKEKAEDDE